MNVPIFHWFSTMLSGPFQPLSWLLPMVVPVPGMSSSLAPPPTPAWTMATIRSRFYLGIPSSRSSPSTVSPLHSALMCSWPFQAFQGLAMSYSFLCGQCLFLVGTQSIRDGWMILRSGHITGLLGEFNELTLWVRWFRLCCVTNEHKFSVASNTKILFLSHTIYPSWARGRGLCSS